MGNLIVSLVILAIVSISIARIVHEKRKGAKCVGCSMGGSGCSSAKNTD
ncbi:FeoB-associated Cys-rich membrane protein [Reinekea marinisedimentorum]|uniref:Attachment p12 family protein n=1 Tax=Reinekea marinisedimentorum TaxID=230495 RepID=A0A4R3ID76_9GAMM|nr:FeoB-associated Cys-rich membrane protein [Reinekea marinisedimentorum]TCS43677.1 attachment p12 family protein [Reinekea marinisedimentorum]